MKITISDEIRDLGIYFFISSFLIFLVFFAIRIKSYVASLDHCIELHETLCYTLFQRCITLARRKKQRLSRGKFKKRGSPFVFKQDIIGILLIALATFILVSNLTSKTGLVGLYVVKTFFRLGLGVGVYVLPLFLLLFGIVVMVRQEVSELTARLAGVTLLFLTFVGAAQFYSTTYFGHVPDYFSGGGGALGYGIRIIMERIFGALGAYIMLSAAFIISLLMLFNITVVNILASFADLFRARGERRRERPETKVREDMSIPAQMPVIKEMPVIKVDEESPVLEEEPPPPPRSVKVKKSAERKKKKLGAYELPPVDLLDTQTPKEREREERLKETTEFRKKLLEDALKSFGVAARVVNVNQGPAVTRFELQPEPGVKVSRIASLSDDIALNLAAQGVRIEAPIPGKSAVGIEVPNSTITPVRLGEIVRTPEFQRAGSKLFLALGKDLSGHPIYGDLLKMPHLLIAGTTGSGKSVCINSLITSILLKASPDEVKFIMIDPKMVEFSLYEGLPHLLAPVVTDPRRAALTLKEWVTSEMERRYKLFHELGVRNIYGYNHKIADAEDRLPYIVVLVDELADLMMVAAAQVETTICRIAQMARATGIHLVIATQRPSVDIITGLIKANIPSRIAFAVATQVDSRVILDQGGADKLLGRGDMLYHPVGAMKSVRLQGSFVTDKETERIVEFIKAQAAPEYVEEIVGIDLFTETKAGEGEKDSLFADAVKIIIESGQASTSHLQRRLRIGYNRAARLMDEIEAAGLVSKPEGENKPRRILATREALKVLGIE